MFRLLTRPDETLREDPRTRRRLVLSLYGLVGPVFGAVLHLEAAEDHRWAATGWVVGLLLAGAAALALPRRDLRGGDWIFPVAVVPTVCCGIAFVASGERGPAYLGILGAPAAWAAVLFEAEVVVAAVATAVVTCFVAVAHDHGNAVAAANTVVFSTVSGLVAWVAHRSARALRGAQRAEAAAAERALDRARLEGLESRMNDAELVMSADGTIVHANDRAVALYGYARAELVGLPIHRLRATSAQATVSDQLRRAASEGVRFETLHRRKDGVDLPVEVSSRGFQVGGATYLHSLVRDLTEARRADADRRLLASLVEHMADGVIVADASLRVVEYTGAAERIYGWTRAEALGRHLPTDFTYEYEEGVGEGFRGALAAGREARARMRALRKDGRWTDLDLSATPLRDAEGRHTGWLSVARDVGDHVAAEQALREALSHRERALADLQRAMQEVRTLSGLLPICMYCKNVRDDEGYWKRIETYLASRTGAEFTHGLCPDCQAKHYPEG
jgi:PAS domain S-box-containing protein